MDKQLFKQIANVVAIEQMVPKADRGIAVGFALKCAERYEKTLVSELDKLIDGCEVLRGLIGRKDNPTTE